jgi:hypothetical protein
MNTHTKHRKARLQQFVRISKATLAASVLAGALTAVPGVTMAADIDPTADCSVKKVTETQTLAQDHYWVTLTCASVPAGYTVRGKITPQATIGSGVPEFTEWLTGAGEVRSPETTAVYGSKVSMESLKVGQ